jgi:hypothetical protein
MARKVLEEAERERQQRVRDLDRLEKEGRRDNDKLYDRYGRRTKELSPSRGDERPGRRGF